MMTTLSQLTSSPPHMVPIIICGENTLELFILWAKFMYVTQCYNCMPPITWWYRRLSWQAEKQRQRATGETEHPQKVEYRWECKRYNSIEAVYVSGQKNVWNLPECTISADSTINQLCPLKIVWFFQQKITLAAPWEGAHLTNHLGYLASYWDLAQS